MECPFCGFENENDESVCNSCGKTMDFPLNNSNIENSQPKVDKNRTSIDNNNQPNNKVDVHYYPNNNEYNNQYNRPYNTKSKGIGLLLGFLITGAGLCYVDKWADGIAMFFLCWILNIIGVLTLGLGFIPAIALWIYSLIKTSEYIDAYNEGRPY